jgi:hypothetical protein
VPLPLIRVADYASDHSCRLYGLVAEEPFIGELTSAKCATLCAEQLAVVSVPTIGVCWRVWCSSAGGRPGSTRLAGNRRADRRVKALAAERNWRPAISGFLGDQPSFALHRLFAGVRAGTRRRDVAGPPASDRRKSVLGRMRAGFLDGGGGRRENAGSLRAVVASRDPATSL